MLGCFAGITIDGNKLFLTGISVSIMFVTLLVLKRTKTSTKIKISLIYAHLTALFFPFVLFTTNVACGTFCLSCYSNILQMVAISLPTTLILATISGFLVVPTFYIVSSKKMEIRGGEIVKFVKKYSRKLGMKMPKIYAVNRAEPIAFSFRSFKSAIFLSVGLLDILNKKEIEAILLHEIAHINIRSSALKLSTSILRLFSPLSVLARFSHDSTREEFLADKFAINEQKTEMYIRSAKEKIRVYQNI